MALLGSAKSLSFAMPTILDAVEGSSPGVTVKDVCIGYAALGPGTSRLGSLPLLLLVPPGPRLCIISTAALRCPDRGVRSRREVIFSQCSHECRGLTSGRTCRVCRSFLLVFANQWAKSRRRVQAQYQRSFCSIFSCLPVIPVMEDVLSTFSSPVWPWSFTATLPGNALTQEDRQNSHDGCG